VGKNRSVRTCFAAAALLLSVVSTALGLVAPQASAYIFLGGDTDTSICANIGSGGHRIPSYPAEWPLVDALRNFTSPPSIEKVPLEGGNTNWHCRTDTGLTTGGQSCAGWGNGQSLCAGGVWSFTVPIGTPVSIGKQDIESYSSSGSFPKDLSKVEWDFDGNGSFEIQDNGPWVTAQGTSNEQVDSTVTAWTTRARYFEGVFTPRSVGSTTIQMRVTWSDGSTVTSSGVFTATTDSVSAGIARTLSLAGTVASGPVLTGSNVYLSAATSTSTSGYFSKIEWDLDGDGTYEVDGGSTSTRSASFATSGLKTVGVRVTSRGGSTSTATTTIEVRKSPPSGESGVSIIDGATYTNSKSVKLNLVWPEFATEARISNDGGFAASKTQTKDLAASIDWDLDDSVKGIYTKVVYVRFNGVTDTTKTYSDDIILDTTAPVIDVASAATVSGSVAISLKATDDITGVDKVQITNGTATVIKDYATNLSVPLADLLLSVSSMGVQKLAATEVGLRVSDNAGNWSAYKALSVSGVAATPTATTPTVSKSKSATAKSIAIFAKIPVLSTSKVSLKVVSGYAKFCKVSGATLRGVKAGTCKVLVTVTPKKGKAIPRTVTLKVTN
jgi:hypothetical protein